MLKVGITGGIGSGKSTIGKIFGTLGIPVYDADVAAKNLMQTDESVKAAVTALFGAQAYVEGRVNKSYLSSIIFKDAAQLQSLNKIIHPATIAHANEWFARQHTAYAVKEAALIFETNSHQHLDYIIGVQAPETIRIQRVMQRSNIPMEKVKEIIAQQMNEQEKMSKCHFVIDNAGTRSVIAQVLHIHNQLINKAGTSSLPTA